MKMVVSFSSGCMSHIISVMIPGVQLSLLIEVDKCIALFASSSLLVVVASL